MSTPNSPTGSTTQPSLATPGDRVGDGFLSTLADLESRLGALKSMHEQASHNSSALEQREQTLAVREAQAEARVREAEQRQAQAQQLAEQAQGARTRLEEFKAKIEAALEQSRAENQRRGEELARSVAELTRRQQEFDAARATAEREAEKARQEAQSATLAAEQEHSRLREAQAVREKEQMQREAALLKRAQELEQGERQARQRLEDATDLERRAAAERVKAESLVAQAGGREAQAQRATQELSAKEAAAAARAQELANREAELTEQARQIEAVRRQEVSAGEQRERALRDLEHELHEREVNVSQSRDELERERASVAEHARTLAEQMKRSDDESAAAIYANRLEAVQLQLGEVSAARAGLETEVAHAREDIESLTTELLEATRHRGVPKEELDKRDELIAQLTAQHEEAHAALQMLQAQVDSGQNDAQQRLSEAQDRLTQSEARWAKTESRLSETDGHRSQAESQLSQAKAELAESRSRADGAESRIGELEARLSSLGQQASAAEQAAGGLRHDAQAAAELLAESERHSAELRTRVAEIEASLAEASARAEAARAMESAIAEHDATLESERASHAEQRARLDATVESLRGELASLSTAGEQAASVQQASFMEQARLQNRISEMEAEVAAALMAAAAAEALSAGGVQAEPDVASESMRDELERRQNTINELRDQLRAAGSDAETAVTQAMATREREIAELRQRAADLALRPQPAELDAARARAAELEAQVAQIQGGTPEQLEELEKREHAIELLRERLEQAQSLADDATRRAETLAARAPGDRPLNDENTLARRGRLRRYKGLLQGQARKILAAQAALQKRHTECEMVLTHRQKLLALAQDLARVEKRVGSSRARSGAAAATLYLVATVSVLGIMSWEISKRVWPGTYVARAALDADLGRRTPGAEEMAAWQKDHTQLLTDPRLLEVVAERMGRRGLDQLSTAVDLKSRLDKDLYVQSGKPGQLTVELRGEGAEKTAMILDTLVTGYKSVADQMRAERSNDIGVVIAQAATAGTEPLMDKRLEKAASVFGGGLLAVGLAGLVIWSRLVRAKRQFEQAQAVESALSEVEWNQLEASIKRPERGKKD